MLQLLSKIPSTSSGLCVTSADGSSSDVFLHLHYLSHACAQKKRAVLLSARRSDMQYRIMVSRFAIRMDPNLIKIKEFGSIARDAEDLAKTLFDSVMENDPQVVIIDDVSLWERFGLSSTSVVDVLYNILDKLPKDGLLYVSSSVINGTFRKLNLYADTSISLELIGGGFGKDVTGKMHIRTKGCSLIPETTELLYLTGDRSIKSLYPGDASFA